MSSSDDLGPGGGVRAQGSVETLQLGRGGSLRESAVGRGALLGGLLAFGAAQCYLIMYVITAFLIAPAAQAAFTGRPVQITTFELGFATVFGAVGFVVGVLPAAVAGAVAGLTIAAVLRRTGGAAKAGSLIMARRHDWMRGTAAAGAVGVPIGVAAAILFPDPDPWAGLVMVGLPLLIFTAAGGPFAVGLRRSLRPDRAGGGQAST